MRRKEYDGKVIKAVAGRFCVDTVDGVKLCAARGKLRANDGKLGLYGDIYVGDNVTVAEERDGCVIDTVKPRRNSLIRPYVANIDMCFIVIATEPEPDFMLVDKVIVNCLEQNIEPLLAVNKADLKNVDVSEYENVCKTVICSAATGVGIEELFSAAKGKTVCMAGQSAVGKSSIINAILDSDQLEVGALARKIKRGKNTTRHIEIYNLGEKTYIADTCGFSMLEAVEIEPSDLRLYYDDFEAFRRGCRFNTCTHIDEPDCAVKMRVGEQIGRGRYARYLEIYKELEERKNNRYN